MNIDCWAFPSLKFAPQKVKVLNKKYCWLYPEKKARLLKKLDPNFEHCKTLYTKCDFNLESCVQETVLQLENELRAHQALWSAEMKLQNKLVDQLWVLSQRYLFLTSKCFNILSSGVCVKLYPEVVSEPTEQRNLCDFHRKLKCLNMSKMNASLAHIKETLKELDRRCGLLDMTVESPFVDGNWYQRPLVYVREIIDDVYQYFYGVLCKLKCWAQLLDPGDSVAIEDYMALVKPSDDYKNYLMIGMDHCKCFRTRNKECIKAPVAC